MKYENFTLLIVPADIKDPLDNFKEDVLASIDVSWGRLWWKQTKTWDIMQARRELFWRFVDTGEYVNSALLGKVIAKWRYQTRQERIRI